MATALINQSTAFTHLTNGSMMQAASESYLASPVGQFFWPLLLMFTLVIVYIKTESPAAVFVSSIIGVFALGVLLPTLFHYMFYITVVLTLLLNLWTIFGRTKDDS